MPSIRAFYEAMRIFHRKHFESSTAAPLNWLIYLGITLKEWQALARNRRKPVVPRGARCWSGSRCSRRWLLSSR